MTVTQTRRVFSFIRVMDSNIDENHLVITKIDKTGLIRFLQFIKNRPVTV
jgi:hypothetical protein